MSNTHRSGLPQEQDLSVIGDRIEQDVVALFWDEPGAIWGLIALLFALIISPLFVFWIVSGSAAKDWSETVKNVIAALAFLVAAFGVFKWLDERRNRSTDVLLMLEKEFQHEKVMLGRGMVERGDYTQTDISVELDCLLRFYVILYGVLRAKQIPQISLSICFRYWLAHYFRSDRTGFRRYVDDNYPTLSQWLRQDCGGGLAFFGPERLFPRTVDQEFIRLVRAGKAQCA